ncbi:uracil-DNA glycosylase [Candidatus Gracilibacteria bacterium]|nr:uracil-DNA glycosylase [Candidatus Gracilibacteria bacterium]
MNIIPNIKNSWKNILEEECQNTYFKKIEQKINDDINNGITIYPEIKNIFKAFEKTSFDDIKVVILGQDPYHGKGQAQGFCFSVPKGTKLPPSLKNIYKELNIDTKNGDLTPWTKQGVLLLNAILTVQEENPASHAKIGWEQFTDNIIKKISKDKKGIIFLLWGTFAQSKEKLIDHLKHYILKTTHPSPFSAYRGFIGSNCFLETNKILKQNGKKEINWNIEND